MGLGDELMAIGQARAIGATAGRRAICLDKAGLPRWHPLFEGVPWLARTAAEADLSFVNGSGCRPYIDYTTTTAARWAFLPFGPTPAMIPRLVWQPPSARRVLIEPSIKPQASPNKQWGRARWQDLANRLSASCEVMQAGPDPSAALDRVRFVTTGSFRAGLELMARCDAAVLPEGGLHHAAAALGLPAVVLFGAFISPATTGYPGQISHAIADPEAQGWRGAHPRCAAAWSQITTSEVLASVLSLLSRKTSEHPA
jgi:hypothetical protein